MDTLNDNKIDGCNQENVSSKESGIKSKVTILIPCYNEEDNLPLLYEVLCNREGCVCSNEKYTYQILFVNDGSSDKTQEVIEMLAEKDDRIDYVSLSRNFGKENAMLAGFDYAKGDCLTIIDADLQDPPELIIEMLKYWEEGYEDVYAKRSSRGKESWLRKTLSLSFYNMLQRTSKFDMLPNVGDFRLLDRKCVEIMKELREKERYTKGLFAWIGFKKKEIIFERQDRLKGESGFNYSSLFRLAIDGIISFTTAPLRIATIFGILVSFAAFAYMIHVFVKALLWGDPVAGYPSLMVVILFLGGIQLLSVGIIGEYLARIFNESKNRPVYVVGKSKIN